LVSKQTRFQIGTHRVLQLQLFSKRIKISEFPWKRIPSEAQIELL